MARGLRYLAVGLHDRGRHVRTGHRLCPDRLCPPDQRLLLWGLSLIVGGAVGNVIDRLRLGAVIDFLLCYAGPYEWPAFNVADSAITIGTAFILIHLWRHRRD
jgi:lipoprotein signal peptidase